MLRNFQPIKTLWGAMAVGVVLSILICIAIADADDKKIPDPALSLTATEIQERKTLMDKYSRYTGKIAEYQAEQLKLNQDQEKDAVALWLKAKLVQEASRPVAAELQAWFTKTAKAHNCEGCELQGDSFIRPSSTN